MFPQNIIEAAWNRAGGRCECNVNCHSAHSRCRKVLDPQNNKEGMKWHAHHISSDASSGSDGLANCLVMCVSCHKNTRSYGRS